ncbi:hypothetical protein Taro_027258, partial [Colocasia esculenta]|nr:hypothetical protein [Colocasia esculenta]
PPRTVKNAAPTTRTLPTISVACMKKEARLLFRQWRRRRQQPVSPVGATRRTCSASLAFSHQLQMDSSPSESSSVRYCYNPTLHWNPQVEEYFVKAYGSDHFARISRALTFLLKVQRRPKMSKEGRGKAMNRHPSSYSCIRVNTPRASVDSVIEKLTSILHERNLQSTINSLCIDKSNGSAEGDHDLKLSAHEDGLRGDSTCLSIQKCQIPGLEYVLFVTGSGPHLLQYDDASGLKEVIVSRKCAEAVLRGAQVCTGVSILNTAVAH